MCCFLILFDFWANIWPLFLDNRYFVSLFAYSIAAISVAHIHFNFVLVNCYLDLFEHVIYEFPETLFSLVFV